MSYPKNLEDYSTDEISKELGRRRALNHQGLCSYCQKPLSKNANDIVTTRCRLHEYDTGCRWGSNVEVKRFVDLLPTTVAFPELPVGEGYRRLELNEVIQDGDEATHGYDKINTASFNQDGSIRWFPVYKTIIGTQVKENQIPIRRKV